MNNEIRNGFLEQGLDPGSIIADGKIHRFKVDKNDSKNSGWYVCHQNHARSSGELFYVCVFGNYRINESWTVQSNTARLTADDKKTIKEQIAKAKKTEESLRLKIHEETSKEVNKLWETFGDEGVSQYLIRKNILDHKNLGIKFDAEGNFYVPGRDIDGKLWTWEKVRWDGEKRFCTGGRLQGCFHIVGKLSGRVFRFAEGFSTSASIAIGTGDGVVCCFSASNMSNVIAAFRQRYPEGEFYICGDDDKWKDKNTGRDIANELAKKYNASVIFPEFKDEETKPKDWNDLHSLEGIEEVKKQILKAVPKPKMALYPLGFSDSTYFFTSTDNRQVNALNSLNEDNLLKLMPLSYWEAMFPAGTERSRVDWTLAKSELMAQCRRKGIFDGGQVRGAGVWNDAGRVVVNMGDHLIVDGSRIELGQIKSRYTYTLAKKLQDLSDNPLSIAECKVLLDACSGFKWSKPKEAGLLLAGILVLSRVCGALPVRPHCWLTGGAQTGKTTLLERLIKTILGESKIYVQGNTTEAGVRQSLKADAVPVLFDEFETNGPRSAENIASCVELMRASWASSGAVIVKGGAQGNASHYQVRFSAIVSSIRTKLTNDADKGRFTVLELAQHGGDQEHWSALSAALNTIDEEFSERLFARTVKMMPIMLQNFKLLKSALARRADSRFGDQYGMILAGVSILLQDGPIDETDAEFLAENVGLDEEREIAKQADHDDALKHLLTTKTSYLDGTTRTDSLIGSLIEKQYKSLSGGLGANVVFTQNEKNALLTLGIRVELDFVGIVASNHAELESKVWRNTKWSNTWGNSLQRIKGTEKKKMRVSGKPEWVIQIPISTFEIE